MTSPWEIEGPVLFCFLTHLSIFCDTQTCHPLNCGLIVIFFFFCQSLRHQKRESAVETAPFSLESGDKDLRTRCETGTLQIHKTKQEATGGSRGTKTEERGSPSKEDDDAGGAEGGAKEFGSTTWTNCITTPQRRGVKSGFRCERRNCS